MSETTTRIVSLKKTRRQPTKKASARAELHRDLFRKPPLLRHEDQEQYLELARNLSNSVRPRDEVEWLWVKDLIDLSWDIFRSRRLKTAILENGRRAALEEVFKDFLFPGDPANLNVARLSREWFTNPSSRKEAEELLASYGLDAEAVMARCFVAATTDLETLERIMTRMEARRNRTFHELERWRANLGRRPTNEVIELEASIVPEE